MPDWLTHAFASDANVSISQMILRQASAFLLGCVVAGIYRFTHGNPGQSSRALVATLVMLTVLIAMLTSVVGDNIARAFSIVGALSIVRFRTVVEDTRDTAFVIFAVTVGMAAGAGYLRAPLVTIPIAGLAAFLFRPGGNGYVSAHPPECLLTIRIGPAFASEDSLTEVLASHLDSSRLTSITTARQGAAFEKTYVIRMRSEDSITPLVQALNGLQGVLGVEVRRV